MFCPKCSQQVIDDLKFCSKCGLALDPIKNLLADSPYPQSNQPGIELGSLTPHQKGIRQGFQLVLLSLILIPACILLAALFPPDDVLVESSPSDTAFEKISQAILATLFLCGLARMFYAYLFERNRIKDPPGPVDSAGNGLLFPSPVSFIESDRVKTAELVEPQGGGKRTSDRLNKH